MMKRKERLLNTLLGKEVDRPPVSLYEIDRIHFEKDNESPYNVYSDPSWQPLLEMAWEKTDIMAPVAFTFPGDNSREKFTRIETREENGSIFTSTEINIGGKILTKHTRRDKDISTTWTLEHLCKTPADLKAYLELPEDEYKSSPDLSEILSTENKIGDRGIVYLNTPDPICVFAPLFEMSEFTIIAMTEKELVHKALRKFQREIIAKVKAVSEIMPGKLWRICGPEYASPPYLPPELFKEYVLEYDRPIIETIHKYGGYVRLHSHGNLRKILDHIAKSNCDMLEPIEPPPQGDVELAYVRKNYGKNIVLGGNLEASDIENLETDKFREKVKRALEEGTGGSGRGFILLPSSAPYGRKLSALSMKNYECIFDCIGNF